ncbi:collagen binding domain-containing protein [Paenibacillus sp. sgz500958]|uniref:collagen binding domain-containing protein n=1 Tax=Paenibacillus sp. sgz500958 TaxID=3242475 RepID=UPI0036D373EC
MVKKRLSVIIILVMLIAQYTYGLGVPVQVRAEGTSENTSVSAAAYGDSSMLTASVFDPELTVTEAVYEFDQDIMTSVTLSVYNADGQPDPGPVFEQGSNVQLDFTWAIPNGYDYKPGDYYFTFTLPAEFKLFNDVHGSLESDSGPVGTFTVSQATHEVVMTFNDFIKEHDNVHGTLRISTKFDVQVIKGSTTQEILFPINGTMVAYPIIFKPTGLTIQKSGVPDGFNAKSIHWTVDVNKSLAAVSNAVVTDPIPAGLTLNANDIAVYELNVALDGTATKGSLVDPLNYSAEITGSTLNLQFNSTINKAYRIEYDTLITNEALTKFTNTATFKGDNLAPVSSSATVTVARGVTLDKTSTYNWGDQTITWSIKYNYNEKEIAKVNAHFTDLFTDTQKLINGSLVVYPVTIDSSGTATKQTALDPSAYTVTTETAANKKGFKLQFNNAITSPYLIEYKTTAIERVTHDTIITNTVTDGTYRDEAYQQIRTTVIYKNLGSVNYQTKTADWKITFNGDDAPMSNVKVTDVFPYGGLKFIPGTFIIKNSAGETVDASEYDLQYDPSGLAGFTVTFHSPIYGTHTINYSVEFNNDWITGNTDQFHNTATVFWVDMEDPDFVVHSAEAKGLFNPRFEEKYNGIKSGSYNAIRKEITWRIGFNYNGKTLENATLKDWIKAPQTLKDGSLKVYHMNIAVDGTPSIGSEVSSALYTYILDGNVPLEDKVLTLNLGSINGPYYVIFTTGLEGQIIDSKVDNTAKLYDGLNPVSKDLTASVKIPYGGELLDKTGVQNGDKIKWTVNINRTQSYLKNVVITDTPSPNQIILSDTFHLYKTNIPVSGVPTTSTEEWVRGADKDYTIDITEDSTGKQIFILKFNKDIRTTSVLTYETLITASNGEQLTNTASLKGDNVVTVTKDTTKIMIVGVSSGSGTGTGERSTLTVKKVDAENNSLVLSGAKFNLYRVGGEEPQLLDTQTTGPSGTAVFSNILSGSYILIETAAPDGYVLDSKERPVTLSPGANIQITATNNKQVIPTPSIEPSPSASTGPSTPPSSEPTPTPSTIPGEVVIDEPVVPAGPGTPEVQPTPPVVQELPDDEVPLGTVDVVDDEVPAGTVQQLPKTGEASPMPLYVAGMALIAGGFVLNRLFKRNKRSE